MTNEEKAKIIKEAFERFPIVMVPNQIDNRFPVDANRQKRDAWLSQKLKGNTFP